MPRCPGNAGAGTARPASAGRSFVGPPCDRRLRACVFGDLLQAGPDPADHLALLGGELVVPPLGVVAQAVAGDLRRSGRVAPRGVAPGEWRGGGVACRTP